MCSLSYMVELDKRADYQLIMVLAHLLHYDMRKQTPKK